MIMNDKINKIENFYKNIVSKYIELKVSTKYLKYLRELGYIINMNDIVTIPIEHLPFGSGKKILVKCKICSEIKEIAFINYVTVMKKGYDYKCKKCNTLKSNNIRIYGVENPMELNIFIDKIKETKIERYNDKNYNNRKKCKETKLERYNDENYNNIEQYKNTCLEKYNVDNISKVQSFKDKKSKTLNLNYNVNSTFALEKSKENKKITLKNKYDVDNVFQIEWVKEKSKKTMMKRYGVENPFFLSNKRYKIKFDERFNLYYQGTYEKHFLDFCIKNNIKVTKPTYILYFFNNKEYKYFPDYYIESLNLLIEIKSDYIFEIQKEKNIAKHDYSIRNGFEHIFIINKDYNGFIKTISKNV